MHSDQIESQCANPSEIADLLAFKQHPRGANTATDDLDAFGKALSIVLHDLRGPLANLSLLVEGISRSAEESGESQIARKAENAEQIIDHMSGFLSAVLERSLAGRDPLSASLVTVNLVEILLLAFSINRPTARRKLISFRCLAIDPVPVSGDAELLLEAFDNLIRNAIHHSPDGGTITCDIGSTNGGDIQVRIGDDGPGFKATDLMRAFTPFASASGTPPNNKGSGGLGLWIARLIAKRHGGQISAHNGPNGGAIITVRLRPAMPDRARSKAHCSFET